jgi:hypothetical protein
MAGVYVMAAAVPSSSGDDVMALWSRRGAGAVRLLSHPCAPFPLLMPRAAGCGARLCPCCFFSIHASFFVRVRVTTYVSVFTGSESVEASSDQRGRVEVRLMMSEGG